MVDVRFELTTNDPCPADDTICEGISPLGHWQEVNQSSTQSLITLASFELESLFSDFEGFQN